MHAKLLKITERIIQRSRKTRSSYLDAIDQAAAKGPLRGQLSCSNLAHGFAACSSEIKTKLASNRVPNLAIVSAYNDMLSAHQPYEIMPQQIKDAAFEMGAVAQFAGGVPAMCDGVTQGQDGMELSLFSRDLIAMCTGIALSHNMFDAVVCLGVCDKIVPGLLIGALSFGHLPTIFIPSGPMPSGLPNAKKAAIRQRFAEGKVSREELLQAESDSYHSPGTCTFYGTANSNQMLMELMGLHLPSASFVPPNTPLREKLTQAATRQVFKYTAFSNDYRPVGRVIDEKAIVNAVVGLLATGGSTNHTLHLIAIARAAGIQLCWDDFSQLSEITPTITHIYPNGLADVNHFHAAGGMAFVISTLLDAGLLHADTLTMSDSGNLDDYRREPVLVQGELCWRKAPTNAENTDILRPASAPFTSEGGLKLLQGNLGNAIVKVSAVKPEHWSIEAPAIIFNDQESFIQAFQQGELNHDFIAVLRFQGPKANGMPELHKLTPLLGVLQDQGYKVALVTDGRMSGASGKILAAIHVTPESAKEGPLAQVQRGDIIRIDARSGKLDVRLSDAEFASRPFAQHRQETQGTGRELFGLFRTRVSSADKGASCVDYLGASRI